MLSSYLNVSSSMDSERSRIKLPIDSEEESEAILIWKERCVMKRKPSMSDYYGK